MISLEQLMPSLEQRYKKLFSSSLGFLCCILIIKLLFSLFALYIYAKFSPFPDSQRYLNSPLNSWNFIYLFDRTHFADFIFSSLKRILVFSIAVHLFISLLLGVVIWYVLKDEYEFMNKPLLVCCFLLPHFLIWTGIVGKEALAIAGFILIVKACVDLIVWNKINLISFLFGLILGLILRPQYALAYSYLFFISLLISKSKIQLMSLLAPLKSCSILILVIGYFVLVYYQLHPISEHTLLPIMIRSQHYFLNFKFNNHNRWDIPWQNDSDFFTNLFWGIPMSIIGPTGQEALARPMLLPAFIEGCIAFFLLILLVVMLFRTAMQWPKYATVIIWGFFPTLIIGLLINYPFGIFNAGSALRYKQSLAPLFYFYPLILLAAIKRKQFLKNITYKEQSIL